MFGTDRRRRVAAAAAIIGGALGAVYLMLVMFLRVDDDLFPGNEPSIPSVPLAVPLTDVGIEVPLPGISSNGQEPWRSEDRLNILVMGLDLRPGIAKDQPARADTLFVVSIDKRFGRVQMLSFPRDLWAEVPVLVDREFVWGEAKVNAAYSHGQVYKYEDGGAGATVATIEHNYHIDIHHWVVIDWDGFVRLIDAIGGIDITTPETVADFGTDTLEMFPNNTVRAGAQHMDGAMALGYSRVRVDGDIKRIDRQQIVIRAVADQAVSLGLVPRLPEFWRAYNDAIRTDVETGLVPGLGLLARGLDLDNIETFSVAPATYSGIAEDGALILLPNEDELFAVIDQFLADPMLRDEAPAVTIEYPEGMDAAADEAKAHLVTYGVPPEWITLEQTNGALEPGIFDFTGKTYTSAKLSQLFDLRLLTGEALGADGVDVVVRLGEGVELKSP